jgi:hypothetical protein
LRPGIDDAHRARMRRLAPTSSVDLSPNGMGYIGPFTVAGLIAGDGPSYGDTQIRPHATPNGAKIWGLTKVAP